MAKLYFRYGAMNCGKSTAIIQVAYNYEEKGCKVLLVKPSIDTKGERKVLNRSGLSRNVDILLKPNDFVSNYLENKEIDAILVDEAQFLNSGQVDDIYQITKLLNIPVLCYGLRCDFRMQGFPGSKRLLEIADTIEELKNVCFCGKKASQNLRKINGIPVFDGEQVAIDNQNNVTYDSVCGYHYLLAREEHDPKFKIKIYNSKKGKKDERTNS